MAVGFVVTENSVATLVEVGDFSHSPTDFLCCTQKTLRTNKNQGVLFSIRKHLIRKIKDLILCPLFHTVPELALSATPPADSEQHPKHCYDFFYYFA